MYEHTGMYEPLYIKCCSMQLLDFMFEAEKGSFAIAGRPVFMQIEVVKDLIKFVE